MVRGFEKVDCGPGGHVVAVQGGPCDGRRFAGETSEGAMRAYVQARGRLTGDCPLGEGEEGPASSDLAGGEPLTEGGEVSCAWYGRVPDCMYSLGSSLCRRLARCVLAAQARAGGCGVQWWGSGAGGRGDRACAVRFAGRRWAIWSGSVSIRSITGEGGTLTEGGGGPFLLVVPLGSPFGGMSCRVVRPCPTLILTSVYRNGNDRPTVCRGCDAGRGQPLMRQHAPLTCAVLT